MQLNAAIQKLELFVTVLKSFWEKIALLNQPNVLKLSYWQPWPWFIYGVRSKGRVSQKIGIEP